MCYLRPLWTHSKVITLVKVDELMYNEIDDLVLKWGKRFMNTQIGVVEGVELMLKVLSDTKAKIKIVTIDTIMEKVND